MADLVPGGIFLDEKSFLVLGGSKMFKFGKCSNLKKVKMFSFEKYSNTKNVQIRKVFKFKKYSAKKTEKEKNANGPVHPGYPSVVGSRI